jgi:hypothetical protein
MYDSMKQSVYLKEILEDLSDLLEVIMIQLLITENRRLFFFV